MPYEFTAVGWEDWDGDRHGGQPADLEDTQGVFVKVTNPDDPDDVHMFWAFTLEPFEDWAEWWVYIGALMAMHGMSLA